MRSLGTEFKVGIFTLVAAVTIGYMFFVLSPKTFERGKTKTYYTVVNDAAGIIQKSQVKTNGVVVGKVKSVVLETNTTRITMEIASDVKVPKGSRIEVRTRGLLGDTFLEIVRAPDTGEYVEDGGYLPRSQDDMDMQAIMSLVGSIGKDVKQITSALANVLGGEKGEQSIGDIVHNIEELAKNAKLIVTENRADLRSMIANLQKTSEALKKGIGDHDQDIAEIVTNLREFTTSLKDVLDDENKKKIDRIIAALDDSMIEVKGATKNINLISDKMQKGEGTIGKLINDETTLNEVQGAIRDIRDAISPVNKLELIVDYHGEFRRDDTTQNYFNVAFQTRPDRYYLVGLTDSDDVSTTRRTTETVDTPATGDQPARQTVVEREKEDKALRFNLQFAKRWYFAGLRFGLFETTGGIASDFYLFRDRVRLSLEAFNFKSKDNEVRRTAHFKGYASILFFNHVYAIGGVDDPTRYDPDTGETDKKTNYFMGAGLSFNDRDLKALFGAASLGSAIK